MLADRLDICQLGKEYIIKDGVDFQVTPLSCY